MLQHSDLYQVLYDLAIAHGAEIRYKAEVKQIDTYECEVSLSSGEVLSADVIIGADGERGMCRRMVLGRAERIAPTGVTLFEYVPPTVLRGCIADCYVRGSATFNTELATQGMPEDLAQLIKLQDVSHQQLCWGLESYSCVCIVESCVCSVRQRLRCNWLPDCETPSFPYDWTFLLSVP